MKFHLSVPCRDISQTREFYEKELGFSVGRNAYSWFDLDIYGNQITLTHDENYRITARNYTFDETVLPTFHFGVVLEKTEWNILLEKYKSKDFFAIATTQFLEDKTGHHQSFFINDPNGYFIEFKTFLKENEVFATDAENSQLNYG